MHKTGLFSLRTWVFWIVLLAARMIPAQPGPVSHAALIGVGAYPAASGWMALSSANDLVLLDATLREVGFNEDHIRTLQDAAATKEGIIRFLRDTVASDLRAGDLLFLHFSGHGQQAVDDNGDEPDQLDECWVPVNSPKDFKAGIYTGENLLRDDELAVILDGLLARLGPTGYLFLSVDACHSGTSTRGFCTARGTDIIMGPPATVEQLRSGQSSGTTVEVDHSVAKSASHTGLVVFTSSSPDQLSYEEAQPDGQFGAYTYELCRSIRMLKPGASLRDLFDLLTQRIRNLGLSQTPTAEGDLDQTLFAGRLTPPVPVFPITGQTAGDTLLIGAGHLQGLWPGSWLRIYPSGTSDTVGTQPAASGWITSSTAVSSVMALDRGMPKVSRMAMNAYLVQEAPPPLDLSICLKDASPQVMALMDQVVADHPYIRPGPLPARLILETVGDSVFLWTADDRMIWSDQVRPALLGLIPKAIRRHIEASSMRLLEARADGFSAGFGLEVKGPNGWVPFTGESATEGAKMRFRISNNGQEPFYYSIVDVTPKDDVAVLAPQLDQDPESFRLNPGKSISWGNFVLEKPFGQETVKLICTDRPVRLKDLSSTRGIPVKPHPLELLFLHSFPDEEGTRGIGDREPPPGKGSVSTVNFRIVPAQ